MKLRILVSVAVAASGCQTSRPSSDVDLQPISACVGCVDDRIAIASNTCNAQEAPRQREYLAAVQDLIAQMGGAPGANGAALNASLDRFREEINASYRTVVMRCKTHMQCLEVNRYNEASCYMAASDRKDAEREFRQLSFDLRDLERQVSLAQIEATKAKARAKTPAPNISVETNVNQNNQQDQNTRVGDDIEDQDVLVMCGVERLLESECRRRCTTSACR